MSKTRGGKRSQGQDRAQLLDRGRTRSESHAAQDSVDDDQYAVSVHTGETPTPSPKSTGRAVSKAVAKQLDEQPFVKVTASQVLHSQLPEPDYVEVGDDDIPFHSSYPQSVEQLQTWQVGVQMTHRLIMAWSFPFGFGPHTFGQLGKPSPAVEMTLMVGGVPLNDAFGEEVLVPPVMQKRPWSTVTKRGAFTQAVSIGAVLAIGCGVGLKWGGDFQDWISASSGAEKVLKLLGSSALAGVVGSGVKIVILKVMDAITGAQGHNPFIAEHPDDPKTLYRIQNWAHEVVSFSAVFALKETIRNALLESGKFAVANSSWFAPVMIVSIDMAYRNLGYFGRTARPFTKWVNADQPARVEHEVDDETLSQRTVSADSAILSPGFPEQLSHMADGLEHSLGHAVESLIDPAFRDLATVPTRPTKMQIAKVVGKSALAVGLSASVIVCGNYLFIQSKFGKDCTAADREKDVNDHDAFGMRFALDFARFIGNRVLIAGVASLVSIAGNRCCKWWNSGKKAGSGQQHDAIPQRDPTFMP